jgi:putative chitinase
MTELLTADQLRAIMPEMPRERAQTWAKPLGDAMARWGIASVPARAAFLAVCGEESGFFKARRESLEYTAQGLANTWARFSESGMRGGRPNGEAVRLAALGQEAIANVVYANPAMGNTEPGDGWEFRGGGPIQITFRATWQKCAEAHGLDLDRNELAAWADEASSDPAQAASCAAWFFTTYKPRIMPLVETGEERDFLAACRHVGVPPSQRVIDLWLALWKRGCAVLAQ